MCVCGVPELIYRILCVYKQGDKGSTGITIVFTTRSKNDILVRAENLLRSLSQRTFPRFVMIRVTFLGTSASQPTLRRNVSAIAIQRNGDSFLFDCGEGTQRQMMRYGTGFGCDGIYVTHLHADHCLGISGLLRTMGLQGRTAAMNIYGPDKSKMVLDQIVELGVGRVPFPVFVHELKPGDRVDHDGYHIEAFSVEHGLPALGYALLEEERPGRFDVGLAHKMGIPEGPLFSVLHSGNPVEIDGRWIRPDEIVGPTRPGRKLVYTGDTRPNEMVKSMAKGASLLIHEATFTEEEKTRAKETRHSTAREAAVVARDADVSELLLTHISSRYSDNPSGLLKEAQGIFPKANVARDGQVFEIPYEDNEQ